MISLSSCHLVILSFHYLVLLGYTRVHFRLVIYIVVTLDVYIYVPVTQRITLLKTTRSTPQDATNWRQGSKWPRKFMDPWDLLDSSQEDWRSYTERLEQYFAANDVAGAGKQRAILLSSCGASTYQLIRNLVAPDQPKGRSFDELVKLVEDHHQPPPSAIVQRFNFHSRSRRQGETVSAFVAELRKLSEYCQFGDTLTDMLRDRLVCGINDQKLQRRLLAEPTLTYDKAFALAQAL